MIGYGHPPFIIAEISANHNGSVETAMRLIDAAKAAGADAVKLQTYKPETITLDSDAPEFTIEGGLWDGRTLFDLYKEAHMPWEWHAPLFAYARKIGITIFSSPFDSTAIDLLETLNAPAYKIASFEAVDTPLIRYAARTGKPLIISTGMADDQEIEAAIRAARSAGCTQLAILHCVSGYPAAPDEYNLLTIPDMVRRFGEITGLSDHTIDNTTSIAAVTLGAAIIEKHFTLDRNGVGPDNSFSLEPEDLAGLCNSARTAWNALGQVNYARKESEKGNIKLRRSLYFVRNISKGAMITPGDIKSVRPGYGLPPKEYDRIVGRTATRDITYNTPVTLEAVGLREDTSLIQTAT
jgi:N-acetylneuraminate synthase